MKKFIGALIIIASALTFSSCNGIVASKLDDTYRMDRVFLNGSDNTQTFNAFFVDYKIVLTKEKRFSETYNALGAPIGIVGSWQIKENGKRLLLMEDNGNQQTRNYLIFKHNSKVLQLQLADDSGDIYEYHLIRL